MGKQLVKHKSVTKIFKDYFIFLNQSLESCSFLIQWRWFEESRDRIRQKFLDKEKNDSSFLPTQHMYFIMIVLPIQMI